MKAHKYKGHVIRHAGGNTYRIFHKGDYVAYGTTLEGAKHWVDSYGKKPAKKNPGGRKLTKLQKKVKAAKASAKRRVATALAKYLKQENPGRKVVGAKIYRGKGGARKIIPIFENAGKRRLLSESGHVADDEQRVRGLYMQNWSIKKIAAHLRTSQRRVSDLLHGRRR